MKRIRSLKPSTCEAGPLQGRPHKNLLCRKAPFISSWSGSWRPLLKARTHAPFRCCLPATGPAPGSCEFPSGGGSSDLTLFRVICALRWGRLTSQPAVDGLVPRGAAGSSPRSREQPGPAALALTAGGGRRPKFPFDTFIPRAASCFEPFSGSRAQTLGACEGSNLKSSFDPALCFRRDHTREHGGQAVEGQPRLVASPAAPGGVAALGSCWPLCAGLRW